MYFRRDYGLAAFIFLTCFSSICIAKDQAPIGAADNQWIQLFNGRDLTGWQPKFTKHPLGTNLHNTFKVQDGLLTVSYSGYTNFEGQFGHLFYTQPFSHYALSVTYRFLGQQVKGGPPGWAVRNSGVMFHAQAPDTMTISQDFPISIEMQFLGGLGNGKPRPTANVCTPGTHIHREGLLIKQHCVYSNSPTYDGDGWVTVDLVVLGGGSVTHYVNGSQVLKYTNPVLDKAVTAQPDSPAAHRFTNLNQGYIALQSESHPVQFKTVKLLNLAGCTNPAASNHRPYYVKSEPEKCIFSP
ncbi:MAG: DUF1080 domain-containing protein [Pseudomonadota bacterium]